MYKLVARIDSFDPRYLGEFKDIAENGTYDDMKKYLENNCACDPETFCGVCDYVLYKDPEYIITFMDLMREEVCLYLVS